MSYLAVPSLRRRAIANLAIAFPEMPGAWARRVALRAFRERAITTTELMRFARRGPEGLGQVAWEDPGAALRPGPEARQMIVISAHLGNYWLVPLLLSARGTPTAMLATMWRTGERVPLRGVFREYVYRVILPSAGVSVVDVDEGARATMESLLRQGVALFVLADLSLARRAPARFFAAEHHVPAGLARWPPTPAPRWSPCSRCGARGPTASPSMRRWRWRAGPEETMSEYLRLVEEHAATSPEQWFWFHRRW